MTTESELHKQKYSTGLSQDRLRKTDAENILDTPRGVINRKCESWIASFIAETSNLGAPTIWRQWAAISVIAAVLEQRVWLQTSSPLYPNLYLMIVGPPGTGKTRTLRVAKRLLLTIPEFGLAPTSVTFPALVDAMDLCKRTIAIPGSDEVQEYNSIYICAEELGAFIHKWDEEMIKGLSAFYDVDPYAQNRRTNDLKIKIDRPQVNMICACTPQDLLKLMPDVAWGQGFTSRTIMIYSPERLKVDDFARRPPPKLHNLSFDLNIIHNLSGEFHATKEYISRVNSWIDQGEPPIPKHPKLLHYISRRKVNIYKLSMVASVDRSNALVLREEDFNRAYNWLCEAESLMPEIFKTGAVNLDAQAMDEIRHFVMAADRGKGVEEHKITYFARDKIQISMIKHMLDIMEGTGMLRNRGVDPRTGYRLFSASDPEAD
jgi:hypothetical protein